LQAAKIYLTRAGHLKLVHKLWVGQDWLTCAMNMQTLVSRFIMSAAVGFISDEEDGGVDVSE